MLEKLLLILVCANLMGYLSKKIGQPAVVGQLLTGVILGPSLLGILDSSHFIEQMAKIGVIILMFMAGLETNLELMKKSGYSASLAAIGGVLAPMSLGAFGALYFGYSMSVSIFVGSILTATSVSISVQVLMELDKLESREGVTILGAAVLDDVLGMVILALVLGTVGTAAGNSNIGLLIGKIVAFFVIGGLIGFKLVPKIIDFVSELDITEVVLGSGVIICFAFALVAEKVGLDAIIGAYLAGIALGQTEFEEEVFNGLHEIGYSLLIPIFFVNIGLIAEVGQLGNLQTVAFVIVLTIIAVLTKIIGCGLGSKLAGLSNIEALRVGTGMISRGEVGLIIATIGMENSIISNSLFSGIVIVVLITTIVTPILLDLTYKKPTKKASKRTSA